MANGDTERVYYDSSWSSWWCIWSRDWWGKILYIRYSSFKVLMCVCTHTNFGFSSVLLFNCFFVHISPGSLQLPLLVRALDLIFGNNNKMIRKKINNFVTVWPLLLILVQSALECASLPRWNLFVLNPFYITLKLIFRNLLLAFMSNKKLCQSHLSENFIVVCR